MSLKLYILIYMLISLNSYSLFSFIHPTWHLAIGNFSGCSYLVVREHYMFTYIYIWLYPCILIHRVRLSDTDTNIQIIKWMLHKQEFIAKWIHYYPLLHHYMHNINHDLFFYLLQKTKNHEKSRHIKGMFPVIFCAFDISCSR